MVTEYPDEERALAKAAEAINKDEVPKKPAKVTKKSAEPNSKNQSPNVKKQEDGRKELERWKKFVTENRLGLKDQNGNIYLKVEAWNYLFALKGISATILDMSRYPDTEEKPVYIAKAGLIPMSKKISDEGIPLGATAFGACKVGEGIFQEEYSALSMAQTRAIGKLGRTVYAHLATACGYKATPLEEMTFEKDEK